MITMKEIAEKAGVSRTTVSFVLNGKCQQGQRVSEAVQKKVLATAKQLGYVRNDLVLSMVKGRSYAIGVVSEFDDFMFPIIRGFFQAAQNHGYSVRLFKADGDVAGALTKAMQARVEAIVCLGISNAAAKSVPETFLNMGIPIYGLSGDNKKNSHFDQRASAAAMTEYLVQCGYKKIICYGGNYRQMVLREAGYRDVMEKYQLVPEFFNYREVSFEELVARKPDGIFCGDDYLAAQLLQWAYQHHIRVPEAFSVAGFGNTVAGKFSSPALTTVDEPYFETGLLGMEDMIAQLEKRDIPERAPLVGEIIVRESTRNIVPQKL